MCAYNQVNRTTDADTGAPLARSAPTSARFLVKMKNPTIM
jgi:hypothetical protein